MDASFRNLLLGLAAYVAVATAALWWVWWRTARIASLGKRAWFRALAVSLLFSPTLFACGGVMPLPFPVLLAFDLYAVATSAASPCGFQSILNAPLVAAVGLVFGLAHIWLSRWQHGHAKRAI